VSVFLIRILDGEGFLVAALTSPRGGGTSVRSTEQNSLSADTSLTLTERYNTKLPETPARRIWLY
jgi:hypothetical protein